MKFKSHRRGFTLIELLVVISIISLLSSVILASVRDARDKAQQTAYRQYLREVIKTIEIARTGEKVNITSFNWYVSPYINFNVNPGIDINYQSPPSFVTSVSSNAIPIMLPGEFGDYSCEKITDVPYIIYFFSQRDDLKFPKIYEGESRYVQEQEYIYCLTTSVQ